MSDATNVTPELSFSVLGQTDPILHDGDADLQGNANVHWTARKVCAALKVTSSIMKAIVVHPGGDSTAEELANASREIMTRASVLTDCAMNLLKANPNLAGHASYKNLMRQQAAEVVSAEWRMAHSANKTKLTTEQITDLYSTLLSSISVDADGETPDPTKDFDSTTMKRLSLFGVIPEIAQAVNSFNYFAPDPTLLIEKGLKQVTQVVGESVSKFVSVEGDSVSKDLLFQSLAGKVGSLYAANYRAISRKDVMTLQRMDDVERSRHLYDYRLSGLPTEHIDAAFKNLVQRMITIVCDAVPEITQPTIKEVEPLLKEAVDPALQAKSHQPS